MSLSDFAWVAVFPALGLLILVHELGHFWAALKMGVVVEEFGIGYPPRMKTLFTRKGVRYTLNWLPLGGFVRMRGEEAGFNEPGSLSSIAPWRRIIVLGAGVTMNMITAALLFALIFAIWGKPEPVPGEVVVASVMAGMPAEQAGLLPDDRIVSINGTTITEDEQVRELVQASGGAPLTLVVERNGEQETITNLVPQTDESSGQQRIGIGYGMRSIVKDVSIIGAIGWGIFTAFAMFYEMLVGFAQLIGGLFGASESSVGGVAGPVGIARLTGEVAQQGWQPYLSLTALLSVNLALINLLPIPALDGSRIVFAAIEWIRGGRRINPEKEAMVHAVGMLMLLGLIVLITISDISSAVQGAPALPQ